MPLFVHCPNRCQIRVPANRAGKVIRCVVCQAPIKIPQIESPLLRTGNWVECRAKRAIKKSDVAATDPTNQNLATNAAPEPPMGPQLDSTNANLPLEPLPQTARLLRAKPWRTVEPLTSVDLEDRLTPIDLEVASPSESSNDPTDTNIDSESDAQETAESTPPDHLGGFVQDQQDNLAPQNPSLDGSSQSI